jgi:hypothetical protein
MISNINSFSPQVGILANNQTAFGLVPPGVSRVNTGQALNFGQSTSDPANGFGIVPPEAFDTRGSRGNALEFDQPTNPPARNTFGLVFPQNPPSSSEGENIVFSQPTNTASNTFGITAPTFAAPQDQTNVSPTVPKAKPSKGIQAPEQEAGSPSYEPGSYPVPKATPVPEVKPSLPEAGSPSYPQGQYPQPEANPSGSTTHTIPPVGSPAYPGGAVNGQPSGTPNAPASSSGIPTPSGYSTHENPSLPSVNNEVTSPRATSTSSNKALSSLNPVAAEGIKKYGSLIKESAERHGLEPALLAALIEQESKFKTDAFNNSSGATGLGQLMPKTAEEQGVKDIKDPAQNIEGAAKYLAQQLKANGGDETLALAAYNWGPGNIARYKKGQITTMPQETRNYIQQVPEKYQAFVEAGFN